MRVSSQQRSVSWKNLNNNARSFNGQATRSQNQPNNNNNVSAHTEHLWNMMEDVEIYPQEVHQLLRHEQRNLSNYKKNIEREKNRVGIEVQNMKKEFIHNIEDLKISILASLDRIYVSYMQKYALLKSQLMEIKKIKDEIQIDMERRSNVFGSKYAPVKDRKTSHPNNNNNIMKSIQYNTLQAKKSEMLKYIAELQKDKVLPLNELTRELIVLTQYQNGFYQNNQFQNISNNLIADFKVTLQSISERKYEFIRDPDQIYTKQQKPILDEVYEQQPAVLNAIYTKPITSQLYSRPDDRRLQSVISKVEPAPYNSISQIQQSISFDSVDNISVSPQQTIRSAVDDILLCAIEVYKNLLAVGSKDGIINIYDTVTTQKIISLRGHKAGICKLAIVSLNGKNYLVSGSDRGCSSIVVWDIGSWSIRLKISSHSGAVTSLVDLRDNRSLISGSYDKTINIYNLNNEGKLIYNLPANKTQVTNILLNSNGSKLVSSGLDNSLSVWKVVRNAAQLVETIFLQRIIENNTLISSIVTSAVAPELVYLGTKDGKIKLINIDQGDAYKIYNASSGSIVEMVAVQRNNKAEFPILIFWTSGQENKRVINTDSGRVTSIVSKGAVVYGCEIGPKAVFLGNGKQLAVVSQTRQRRQVVLFKLQIVN